MAKRKKQEPARVGRGVSRKKEEKGSRTRREAPVLTEKQRRFVEFYMGQAAGNATEAARLAGYKGNRATLQMVGLQNLSKPMIRKAIDERVEADPAIKTREDRQRFWSRMMDDKEEAARDRLKASELLGKSQGDFVERHEHSGAFSLVELVTSAQAVLAKRQSGS